MNCTELCYKYIYKIKSKLKLDFTFVFRSTRYKKKKTPNRLRTEKYNFSTAQNHIAMNIDLVMSTTASLSEDAAHLTRKRRSLEMDTIFTDFTRSSHSQN